jgi:hypothetical protein
VDAGVVLEVASCDLKASLLSVELKTGARTLIETLKGGGHIGLNPWLGYGASWPLARLSVAPDSLTFSMWPVK